MKVNKSYVSNNNTYAGNTPKYIVVHNTDNFNAGANALAHAKAQYNGNFNGMSAHYYTDDGDTVYQATPHSRGCWHVGVNYGGRLFGTVTNKNSIGVEMCVQKGYNFTKAFNNTVEFVKQMMKETGIPADRVVQHYDVCAMLISGGTSGTFSSGTSTGTSSGTNPAYAIGVYRVTVDALNIRSGPGTSHGVVGTITDKGAYTITEIQKGSWGRLKSGAGWINCSSSYCKRVGDAAASGSTNDSFKVEVKITDLNIRTGPGTNYTKTGSKTGRGTFTIVETKSGTGSTAGWGRLKSGAGWIALDYATWI